MCSLSFFRILKTASSEVRERTLFKTRFTQYIPDFFFITLYFSVFLSSAFLDLGFLLYLFLSHKMLEPTVIYLVTIVLPGILDTFLYSSFRICLQNLKINRCFQILFSIMGLGAAIHSAKACEDISTHSRDSTTKHLKCFAFPFFSIKNDTLALIRINCLVNAVLKNLPRLFLLPMMLLHKDSNDIVAFMGVTLIMLNLVIFSFTIAATLPIRPTPRVFTSSFCLFFSAFNKFMATMTSCCIVLVIFTTLYKEAQFYALLLPVSRTLIWTWPSWNNLNCQSTPLKTVPFIIFLIFFAFIFGFIYIHPFEGVGKLHYYVFNMFEFISELLVLYLLTDATLACITNCLLLRIITVAFISNFELVNLWHKYTNEKTVYGCMLYPGVVPEIPKKFEKYDEYSLEMSNKETLDATDAS